MRKAIAAAIVLAVVFALAAMDIWAAQKMQIDMSEDRIFQYINSATAQSSQNSTTLETRILLSNPTWFPVLVTHMEYDMLYGESRIASGRTGPFILMPDSHKEIQASLVIDHKEALKAAAEGILDLLTGNRKGISARVYAGVWPFRFLVYSTGK